jgi:hypothetical protein
MHHWTRALTIGLSLVLTSAVAQAQTTALLLINAGPAPIQVLKEDRSVLADVAPGASANVTFSKLQWIRRGSTTYRFNVLEVQRLKRKGRNIVLQFDAKAHMYLMSPENSPAVAPPPAQPKGLPLRPDRTFVMR